NITGSEMRVVGPDQVVDCVTSRIALMVDLPVSARLAGSGAATLVEPSTSGSLCGGRAVPDTFVVSALLCSLLFAVLLLHLAVELLLMTIPSLTTLTDRAGPLSFPVIRTTTDWVAVPSR